MRSRVDDPAVEQIGASDAGAECDAGGPPVPGRGADPPLADQEGIGVVDEVDRRRWRPERGGELLSQVDAEERLELVRHTRDAAGVVERAGHSDSYARCRPCGCLEGGGRDQAEQVRTVDAVRKRSADESLHGSRCDVDTSGGDVRPTNVERDDARRPGAAHATNALMSLHRLPARRRTLYVRAAAGTMIVSA